MTETSKQHISMLKYCTHRHFALHPVFLYVSIFSEILFSKEKLTCYYLSASGAVDLYLNLYLKLINKQAKMTELIPHFAILSLYYLIEQVLVHEKMKS
jgi:hypothetical protein